MVQTCPADAPMASQPPASQRPRPRSRRAHRWWGARRAPRAGPPAPPPAAAAPPPPPPPDRVHAARGLQEGRVVDRVTGELSRDARAQHGVDSGVDRCITGIRHTVRTRRTAEHTEQVVLPRREQTVAQLTVGGQPQPVALPAERCRDRCDDPHRRRAAVERPLLGGRAAPTGHGRQPPSLRECFEDLGPCHHRCAVPRVPGIQRHLLDETQLRAVREGELDEVDDLVVVDTAHRDGVELQRAQARGGRCRDAGQHLGQTVAAGEFVKAVAAERVDRDVESAQPRLAQRLDEIGEPDAVGGHREVDRRPARRANGREAPHHLDDVGAQQRFSTGQPKRGDPGRRRDPRDAFDLVDGEDARACQPFVALLGHAIGAAQRAAVGQRDAQVAVHPPEAVDQGIAGNAAHARRGPRPVAHAVTHAVYRAARPRQSDRDRCHCPRVAPHEPGTSSHHRGYSRPAARGRRGARSERMDECRMPHRRPRARACDLWIRDFCATRRHRADSSWRWA